MYNMSKIKVVILTVIVSAFMLSDISLQTVDAQGLQNADRFRNRANQQNAQTQRAIQQANSARLTSTRQQVEGEGGTIASNTLVVPEEENETIERNRAFGSFIFSGRFAQQSFVGFNPSYEISVGDLITLQLWGGFEFVGQVPVDAQGNIFIPKVGPVGVGGVKNQDLNKVVGEAIKSVFKKNVGVYASLDGAEPVKIYVAGFVAHPGLYAGHASDSVLFFLDRAGGIDQARGSFLDIHILRNGEIYKSVNLYDFVLQGQLEQFQLLDGDTIVVNPVKSQAGVLGDAQNPFLFEFDGPEIKATELLGLARPFPQATHIRINRNNRAKEEVEYVKIADLADLTILPGDVVEVVSDKKQGTISVRVEGEHESSSEFVLPYGASLGDLLSQVNFGVNAQQDAIQLVRVSTRERQKEAMEARLRALESSVLTARSNTIEEATLRTQEAQLVLQFIERARAIEPKGVVSLAGQGSRDATLLEPGDIIRIPRLSNLITVHGDVLFPSSMVYEPGATVRDYIERVGGLSQPKGAVNILLLRRDGTFERLSNSDIKSRKLVINPGDEVFVLPRVQTKNLQIAKDILGVIFQLALSAGVVLGI